MPLDSTAKDLAQDRDLAALARNLANLTATVATLQKRLDDWESKPVILPPIEPPVTLWGLLRNAFR